ncbi:MAG TPA: hypothetical protein VFB45_04400 [Pseudolabrys sp.]|nr:hypothetical protein [Pseudolabrys sp.]
MRTKGRNGLAAVSAAALAAVSLLSACSSSGLSTATGGSSGSGVSSFFDKLGFSRPKTSTATEGTPNPDAQQQDFDCPSVEVRTGAATLTIATKNTADASAADLRYQGSIVRTARECPLRAGVVNLKVGVEGRIVLGPAGGPGQIEVPLRMAVVQEGTEPKTITTKLFRIPVTIEPGQERVTFTEITEDLSFPMPKPAGLIDEYIVYVGFDPQAAPEPKAKKPPAKRRAAARPKG